MRLIRPALAVALLGLGIGLSGGGATGQSSLPVLRVEAPAEAGKRFDVHVAIDEVQNLGGYEFKLTFDPSLIEYESALKGELFVSGQREAFCNFMVETPGEVYAYCLSIGMPSVEGVSGSGDLAVIKLKSTRKGASELGLKDAKFTTPDAQEFSVEVEPTVISVDPGGSLPLWAWVLAGVGLLTVLVAAGVGVRRLRA